MKLAILRPGKSLRATLPESWDYDRVVAVTDAIFADAPIDTWCFYENPKRKADWRYKRWSDRVFELMPILWVYTNLKPYWIKLWGYPEEKVIGRDIQFSWDDKSVDTSWVCFSVFHAVLAAMLEGAKTIDVFGCDNEGYCNYDPRDGSEISNMRKKITWDRRWEKEKRVWDEVIPHAADKGVSIKLRA